MLNNTAALAYANRLLYSHTSICAYALQGYTGLLCRVALDKIMLGDLMSDLYLLFSHELLEQQKREAYEDLDVKDIYSLPPDIKEIWSQIPPGVPKLEEYLLPIKKWLEKRLNEGDYILIQGDFGATYLMVRWAFSKNCKPIYATTERKALEVYENGVVIIKKVFQHVRFRLYE
jgi:hypothetical protein